jgi:hypothetical protein
LAVDASPVGVGAVLSHKMPDGSEKPIQYASKTLNNTQQKYAQIDREAYAIIFGIKKFHQYLYGRKFDLITDNKPVSQIFSPQKSLPLLTLSRMQHYAIFLQDYNYNIIYRSTNLHSNADAMSRLPIKAEDDSVMDEIDFMKINLIEMMPITVEELGNATIHDSTVKELIHGLRTGKTVNAKDRFGIDQTEFSLLQNCLMRGIRAYIPKSLRGKILDELHSSHFGISRTKNLARSFCWWLGIDSDIETMIQSCTQCILTRQNPPKSQIHAWEPSKMPFERIHADFAGPFKGKYFLIVVDSFSKWPEVAIIPDLTAETTIRYFRQIFSRFGLPQILVTDRGTQFTSSLFQDFLQMNGVKHKMGAPYNPSTNGIAERLVYTIKQKLKTIQCASNEFEKYICNILMSYRISVHPATGKSPSMLMFGRQMRSRLDIMIPKNEVRKYEYKSNNSTRDIAVNDRVQAREFLNTGEKWKIGIVIKKLGFLHYMIKLQDGRIWKRHINQIRKIPNNIQNQCRDTNGDHYDTSIVVPNNIDEQNEIVVTQNNPNSVEENSSSSQNNDDLPIQENPLLNTDHRENAMDSPVQLRRSTRIKKPTEKLNL